MAWKDIIKNEPTFLIEGIKKILDESLEEISDEKGTIYQGSKRIKYNNSSIKIILHVESNPSQRYARIYFSPKTGVNFFLEISNEKGKGYDSGFARGQDESISEELQRKILAVAETIQIRQLR
jgi:hypothetical protein